MDYRVKRFGIGLLLLVGLLLVPCSEARAQFDVTDIQVTRLDTNKQLTATDFKEFFNKAHCDCETKLKVLVKVSGLSSADYDFQVVAGRTCLDATTKAINKKCVVLFGPTRANSLTGDINLTTYASGKKTLTAKALMEESCDVVDRQSFSITVYVNKDKAGTIWEALTKKVDYTVDTKAPDSPKVDPGAVKAGEGQATITFKSHTAEVLDDAGKSTGNSKDVNFKGYQVLCAEKSSGAPGLASPPKAEYEDAVNLCGSTCSNLPKPSTGTSDGGSSILIPVPLPADGGGDAATSDAAAKDSAAKDAAAKDSAAKDSAAKDKGPTDAGADTGTTSGTTLCSAFVCSTMQTAPRSITVTGLKNGVTYDFWVITIDSARNASVPQLAGEAEPTLVEDLWERYKRMGGKATGGCVVADGDGLLDGWQAGLLGLAVLLGLALAGHRRRGGRR